MSVPIPRLEGIAGPLKEITLHGNAVVCIHIVLQLGVVIREILNNKRREKDGKRSESVRTKSGENTERKTMAALKGKIPFNQHLQC